MATPPPIGYDLDTGIGTMQIAFYGMSGRERRALIAAMRSAGLTVYGSGRGFLVNSVTVSGTESQFDTYGDAAIVLTHDSGAHPGLGFWQMRRYAEDEARRP